MRELKHGEPIRVDQWSELDKEEMKMIEFICQVMPQYDYATLTKMNAFRFLDILNRAVKRQEKLNAQYEANKRKNRK